MQLITCPICKQEPFSQPKDWSLVECSGCGNRWTFIPQELDADALYQDEVYAVVDNRKSIFERIIFSEAKKVLQKADSILPFNSRRLLDFGSGKGLFLAVAKESGWEVLGIETARERAEFSREKYQVEVKQEFYSEGKIAENRYDLITLNHVLEHLPAPIQLLSRLLQSNLEPRGILYIEVPRADSWQAKIAGAYWMHWDIPKHLTHWTEAGLEKELKFIGFQKIAVRNFSIHLGVLGMLQSLMSKMGFEGNLILLLKRKKSIGLVLKIAVLLPFAWVLEFIAAQFGKGGIIGIYLKSSD
jgi:2-polyprenyl-3-methyl-5-hydroxy-6-metoxy-1,4-benzoquinol methylase